RRAASSARRSRRTLARPRATDARVRRARSGLRRRAARNDSPGRCVLPAVGKPFLLSVSGKNTVRFRIMQGAMRSDGCRAPEPFARKAGYPKGTATAHQPLVPCILPTHSTVSWSDSMPVTKNRVDDSAFNESLQLPYSLRLDDFR